MSDVTLSSFLDAEAITNLYLYGSTEVPENLIDNDLIREPYDNAA